MKSLTGRFAVSLLLVDLAVGADNFRYGQPAQPLRDANLYVPDLAKMTAPASSELRELVERYTADRASLEQFYTVPGSLLQIRRLREFYQGWQAKLDAMPFDSLGAEGRIDWHLMRLQLRYELGLLARVEKRNA